MLECRATGLVYRNPAPHLRAVNAWHPTVVRLDSGELLAAFDLGQGAESLDYRTYTARSNDEGQSWTSPVPLCPEPKPGERRSTHSIRLSRTADGTIVGFGGRYYRDNPEEGLVNRVNLGFVPMDLLWIQSRDEGKTWIGPKTIAPPLVGPAFEICHPPLELRDGRWLAPTATWRGWDGSEPNGMQAIALVSSDRGQSWPEYLRVMNGTAEKTLYWEQSIVELPDHRLLAIAWAFHERTGETSPNPYAISTDGKTFSDRRPSGLHGQTAKLISLGDGRILCVYRRHDKPGLWGNLSKIDGDTWLNLAELPLWQGASSGMSGQDSAGHELSSLKFGFPTLIRLPDGDVFVVFWCHEDSINCVRWLRIRVHG